MTWSCTTEAPVPRTSLESHLEHHFRRFFVSLVRELSGTMTEVPGPSGNTLQFSFHASDGGRHWLLEPQVNLPGARPDFLLSCTDLQVPKVAIFTDGYAYHAAGAHNRLAEDAQKRRVLRESGYLVLSVTAADLQPAPAPPSWYAAAAMPLLTSQEPTIVSVLSQLQHGPAAFLRDWLTEPDAARQRALADVLPYVFAAGQTRAPIDPDTPLAQAAVRLRDGVALPVGSATAFAWRNGPLTVLVRISQTPGGSVRTELAAVLDDRAEALSQHAFDEGWRDWLRLANSLQRHTITITLSTQTLVPIEAPAAAPDSDLLALDPAWREIFEAMLDERGRLLVKALVRAGADLPNGVGDELGASAIPVDLAWSDRRVAVLVEPVDEDVDELQAEGWTVVGTDPDSVLAALAEER